MPAVYETVFTARVLGEHTAEQRGVLACRVQHPAARPLASAENLLGFCFPLGVAAVRPSAFLVTEEFSFTLTGGDGSRLHGFCRRTNDPTRVAGSGRAARRFPQVLCLISQHAWATFFFKVLEVLDQLLRGEGSTETLAPSAPAAAFLASLAEQIPAPPALGAVIRVPLPPLPAGAPPVDWGELRMRRALPGVDQHDVFLHADSRAVELEVPPDLGNGPANAGISLARLLFFLTPRQATTLLASLLLERRVILVSKSADTVSAAVHAAAALLYPLRWQHIFLPLLPLSLKDYLAAPMPYLVGIQAECLPMLRGMAMEEVVMLDLDTLGHCQPELGSRADDAWVLPYADELTDAFDFVRDHIRSPVEFHTTPKATEMVQSFLLKLLFRYRQHIMPEAAYAAQAGPPAAGAAAAAHTHGSGPGSARSSARASRISSRDFGNGAGAADESIRADGYVFDQAGFLAAHSRNAKLAAFLAQFRHSQMYEQFINERLRMAAEGFPQDDPFEQKVSARLAKLGVPAALVGGRLADTGGRLKGMLRKTATLVKASSSSLVAGIKSMGSSHEQELYLARASPSVGDLRRPSPNPSLGSLGAARSGGSFSGLGAGSSAGGMSAAGGMRASTSSGSLHGLHRSSPGPPGGARPHMAPHQVTGSLPLEEARPELFFGEDNDDAESVASDTSTASLHEGGLGGGGSTARLGRISPGPLESGLGRNRSFTSLFRLSPSPSATSLGGSSAAGSATAAPAGMPTGKAGGGAAAGAGMFNLAASAGPAAASRPRPPPPPAHLRGHASTAAFAAAAVTASAAGQHQQPSSQSQGPPSTSSAAVPAEPSSSSPGAVRQAGESGLAAAPTAPAAAVFGGRPVQIGPRPQQAQPAGWATSWPAAQYSPLASGALQSPSVLHGLHTIESQSSLEWAAFASAGAAAEAAAAHVAHTPLAQGVASRASSLGEPRHRHTSSSSSLQSRLSVTQDAFSSLVLDAAEQAEQDIAEASVQLAHRRSTSGSAEHLRSSPRVQAQGFSSTQRQQQLHRSSSGSRAGPPVPQEQQAQQAEAAPAGTVSAGDRSVSWGDWASAWDQVSLVMNGLPAIAEQGEPASSSNNSSRPAHNHSQSAMK